MANIELRKSFFGDALVGEVQPGLSWVDHRALGDIAYEGRRSTAELHKLNGHIASLGFQISGATRGIAVAIGELEDHLGLRLHMQAQVLTAQLDRLERIDEALRTPAKTRAAERIADTGELLRRGRWERALAIASEAIEDDPNNPARFRAAAWALMGLERAEEAQTQFLECSRASDGNERAQALRQAARLTFALRDGSAALALLEGVDDQTTPDERRAVDYDRAVYLADGGEMDRAEAALASASEEDERFAIWALTDPLMTRHEQLRVAAEELLSAATTAVVALHEEIERLLEEADAELAEYAPATGRAVPAIAVTVHGEVSDRIDTLRRDLESAQEDRTGTLVGLRGYLREDLAPRCSSVLERAREARHELEGFRAQTEMFQARVDAAARDLAAEKRGEVAPGAPCMTIAPGFVVRAATITRHHKPLKPGKAWSVALDSIGLVRVRSEPYRY